LTILDLKVINFTWHLDEFVGHVDDEKPSKAAKVEVPPSGFGGMGMGSSTIHMPPQSAYSAVPSL